MHASIASDVDVKDTWLLVISLIGFSLALSVRKKKKEKLRKFYNLELGVKSARIEYKFFKTDLTG